MDFRVTRPSSLFMSRPQFWCRDSLFKSLQLELVVHDVRTCFLLQLITPDVATSLFLSRHHFTFSVVFNCGHDVATSFLMSRHQLPALVFLNRRPLMS